jgi:hypothetical protein
MLAVRVEVVPFASYVAVRVWLPVPEAGLTDSQATSSETLHVIVPQPVLERENVVVPDVLVTVRETGLTVKTGVVLAA